MDFNRWLDKFGRWTERLPALAAEWAEAAADTIVDVATREHLSGPKMPRGVGGTNNATLAQQTGKLAAGVTFGVAKTSEYVTATAIWEADYSAINEVGMHRPKRPFLYPTLQKRDKPLREGFREMMRDEYRKA